MVNCGTQHALESIIPTQNLDCRDDAGHPESTSRSGGICWRAWPHQIYYIMGNEVCERFSFYGMRAILVSIEYLQV